MLISVVVRGDRLRTSVSTQSSSKKYIFVKRDVLYDHRPTFHLIHRYCRLLGASSEGPTQLHAPNTISLLSRRGWPRPRAAGHMNIGESSKHWPKTPPWSRGRAAAPASFPSAKPFGLCSTSARSPRDRTPGVRCHGAENVGHGVRVSSAASVFTLLSIHPHTLLPVPVLLLRLCGDRDRHPQLRRRRQPEGQVRAKLTNAHLAALPLPLPLPLALFYLTVALVYIPSLGLSCASMVWCRHWIVSTIAPPRSSSVHHRTDPPYTSIALAREQVR